jgi:hypothetical protein
MIDVPRVLEDPVLRGLPKKSLLFIEGGGKTGGMGRRRKTPPNPKTGIKTI